jgi:hypothetical protein
MHGRRLIKVHPRPAALLEADILLKPLLEGVIIIEFPKLFLRFRLWQLVPLLCNRKSSSG